MKFLFLSMTLSASLFAHTNVLNLPPPLFAKIGVDRHEGTTVDGSATFRDADDRPFRLKTFFDRPVVLAFAYFRCPTLCRGALATLAGSLGRTGLRPGRDFRVIVASIDPTDRPAVARVRERLFRGSLGEAAPDAVRFLTAASGEPVSALASAVGYRYAYDPRSKEYAHPAAVVVLAPGGRIASYLLGVEIGAAELRKAVTAASENRLTFFERVLLYCFHYDPTGGRYGLAVTRALRWSGAATLGLLAGLIGFLLWRARLRPRAHSGGSA